jgi:hypothetical protein
MKKAQGHFGRLTPGEVAARHGFSLVNQQARAALLKPDGTPINRELRRAMAREERKGTINET